MATLYAQTTTNNFSNFNDGTVANANYAWSFVATATGIPAQITLYTNGIVGTPTGEIYIKDGKTFASNTFGSKTGITFTSGANVIALTGGSTITSGNTYWVYFRRTTASTIYPQFQYDTTKNNYHIWRPSASNIDPDVDWQNNDVKMSIESATEVSLSDSGSGSDAKSILATQTRADTGTGVDAKSITVTQTRADTGTGVDAKAISVTVPARTETGTGVDAKAISVTVPTRAETGTGADTLLSQVNVSSPDTGEGDDESTILASIPLADTGSGNDTESIAASISRADTGSGSEAIQILAAIAINDTGTGAEGAALQIHVATADTVSGSDAVAILAAIARSDSGIATDAAAVMASIAVSDSGVGNEALAFLVAMSLAESGGSSETVSILAHVGLGDSGSGLDTLAVAFFIAVQDSTPHGVDALSFLISPSVSDSVSGSDAANVVEIFRKMINDAGQGSDVVTGIFNRLTIPDTGAGVELVSLVKRVYPYIKRTSPYTKLKP